VCVRVCVCACVQVFIPRTLMEVKDHERDGELVAGGEDRDVYYKSLMGDDVSV